jgi:hypothetical protein
MSFRYSIVALASFAFLLGGCEAPLYTAIDAVATDKITSTEVAMLYQQDNIFVYVPPPDAMAGGLLGAAFQISAESSALNDAVPLRKVVADNGFDASIQTDVKKELTQIPWLKGQGWNVFKDATSDDTRRAIASSNADTVMLLTTGYFLTNGGDTIVAVISGGLYPKDAALIALHDQDKPHGGFVKGQSFIQRLSTKGALYHNELVFVSRVPGLTLEATVDRKQAIAMWEANNGTAVRSALKMATGKLARMLAADLEPMKTWPGADPNTAVTLYDRPAVIVARDADGVYARFEDGTLQYTTSWSGSF